jgi:hypothetical protein
MTALPSSLLAILFIGILTWPTNGQQQEEEEWRQQWKPNNVALNEGRKHIDVNTQWLDKTFREKTGQNAQQVHWRGIWINYYYNANW